MPYAMQDHRTQTLERFAALVKAGPGVHPYALDAAEQLVKDDPVLHGGLVAEVEKQIGEKGVKAARRALDWFRRNP